MGIYLNPSNVDFQEVINSEIYVDKSELIAYTNNVLRTSQKYICVSRPRRFGKSMAANMLTAYYGRGCDSREMFSHLKISQAPTFEKHLNQYNVIHINTVDFLSESDTIDEMIQFIKEDLIDELTVAYPYVRLPKRLNLIKMISTIFAQTEIPFIFVIDEWDCIFRIHKSDADSQTKYLNFLRNILKDKSYVALTYMTGILPIKKYGTLFDETKRWYDGYCLDGISIYNPKSVVEMLLRGRFNNYWTSTETYEALKVYIEMNFDGLRDTVTELLAGKRQVINTATFTNDMVTFQTKDDVLTLLVHLGYLTYDFDTKEISIPNFEISEQFASTI